MQNRVPFGELHAKACSFSVRLSAADTNVEIICADSAGRQSSASRP